MKLNQSLFALAAVLLLPGYVLAQGIEEWNNINPNYTKPNIENQAASNRGAPDISDRLVVGTSSNSNTPSDTLNDVFSVDVDMNTSTSILSANGVWGATADPENERILFTQSSGLTPPPGTIGGGDNLFEIPYAGGAPVLLGRITNAGEGQRIDGLAMRNGRLYGYEAGAGVTNGLYQIDLVTFEATLIANTTNSIGGLDADPETCIIYGTDDTNGQVVTIDTSGVITNLVAYPPGLVDVDGLAVGGGFAYLVTDEAQDFAVLDLSTLLYEPTALTSPFAAADLFSAGALALPAPAVDLDLIFANGFEVDPCADIQ